MRYGEANSPIKQHQHTALISCYPGLTLLVYSAKHERMLKGA
ncbi:hypothetical protein LBMAG21_06850 [Armatimonadota bacterium]|nr:hypothetical protein LBMAG21_06850 [Armatimonadota bacterium]